MHFFQILLASTARTSWQPSLVQKEVIIFNVIHSIAGKEIAFSYVKSFCEREILFLYVIQRGPDAEVTRRAL